MHVKVKLLPVGKKIEDVIIQDGSTGQELLAKLSLAPDAHIITREGNPIPLDDEIKEGERIDIIRIVSGG
ncbi:MAG: MoaD/ThiS family protein [Methanomassiliicoccales archaeon]|nr:MAG: MoaD/ThiS family protein [Methanomassiliicoccales archaeon]